MSTGLPEEISQPGEERRVLTEGTSKQRGQQEPRWDELGPFGGQGLSQHGGGMREKEVG